MTRAYAEVIGDPIAQSKSPLIHGHWLGRLGREEDYRTCHVRAGGLAEYLRARRDDPLWRGCNVTMPHKRAIMPLLDRIDPAAAKIGAVNTVVPEGGALAGYNTDAPGFCEPLAAELAGTHYYRMARMFGTGGAARAIACALLAEKFTIVLAGRDPVKSSALMDELNPGGEHFAVGLGHFAGPLDFAFDDREACLDLVINASPLGMAGHDPLPYDFSHTPPGAIFYDIVTHPLETPLLAGARARGFRTIDGLAMLIGQAAIAFERFFAAAPPRDDGDAELRALLGA